MARYAYDVNTTQRYIDVHKQFQGGLKTVDTDDSLGAVFLRDAENVSLSEFGFIEKRYGTYEKFRAGLSVTAQSKLQGYWEFLDKYIITAVDGKIYYQLLNAPESTFTEFTQFNTVSGLSYPETLAGYLGLEEDFSVGSGFTGFQNTRLMGAANIANVLYIFTGKYPIYIVEEENVLKAYLFAKDDPNYSELIVTGHNLMEDDYDFLYYERLDNVEMPTEVLPEESESLITILSHNNVPKLPYAKDGTLEFNLAYNVKNELKTPFNFDLNDSLIYDVNLESIQYRPSGPGATEFSFTTIDSKDITFSSLNNVLDEIDASINADDLDAFTAQSLAEQTLTVGTLGAVTTLPLTRYDWRPKQRTLNKDSLIDWKPDYGRETQLVDTDASYIDIQSRDVHIDVDINDTNVVETPVGKRLGFVLKDSLGEEIDIETKNREVRTVLNNYIQKDPRNKTFEWKIDYLGTVTGNKTYIVSLMYKAGNIFQGASPLDEISDKQGRIPLITYPIETEDIGSIDLSYEILTQPLNAIQIVIRYKKENDNYFTTYSKILEYYDTESSIWKTLNYTELQNAFPMSRTQRDNVLAVINKPQTTMTLYRHDSQSSHTTDNKIKTYVLGKDLIVKGSRYYIDVPDDVETGNHYAVEFKTTLLGIDVTNAQSQTSYISASNTSSIFYQPTDITRSDKEDEEKSFYNSRYIFNSTTDKIVALEQAFPNYNYTLFEVDNLSTTLEVKNQLGVNLLNVKILKGLLSGNYDFRFNYKLEIDTLDANYNKVNQDIIRFDYIAKDITITEEKLTDYTFFQGDRAHPIWSCNQVIEHFNKLMVYGSEEMPNSVFYSFPDKPFYFPSKFYLDFTNDNNDPIVSVTPYMNILVVQTEESTWGIKGTSGLLTATNPYAPFSINSTVGTIAPKSVRPIRNKLFFLSKQGVVALNSLYAVDESYNIDFMDRNIRNIVPQDKDAVGIQFDNQYWLNFPNYGITLRWYTDKKAWVQDKYGAWNDFNGVFKYQVKDGLIEFITHPSRFETSGNYNIYKVGVDYSLTHDLSGVVVAKFETSFLNQNYPFHPKNYKESKLDFTLQNEYNQTKDAQYTMEENEDIASDEIHTINNVGVLPNHFYRVVYDFNNTTYPTYDGGSFAIPPSDFLEGGDFNINLNPSIGNIQFKTIITYDGGSFAQVSEDEILGGTFSTNSYDRLSSFDFFLTPGDVDETFNHLRIDRVTVKEFDSNTEYDVKALTIGDGFAQFLLPYQIKGGQIDIQIEGDFINYTSGADVYDTTYDDKLTFKTWVISEDQTLNLDNIDSYDQAKADMNIDFNNRLGTWVFGTSDFGKKITAVKTIKLSGKGYNSKIYMEDYSKSKWTLESLGITYKMKRARSR